MDEVRGLSEAEFVARHPYPVLLSEGKGADGATSKNLGGDAPTRKLSNLEDSAVVDSNDAWVVPVRRKESSKHASIITVGRGEDCDIRVSHPLVSKKHAYFTQEGEAFHLSDADSTNCTFADGDKLEAHKPRRLEDSMALRFGPSVKYRFFGSRAFHAFCAMRLKVKDPQRA